MPKLFAVFVFAALVAAALASLVLLDPDLVVLLVTNPLDRVPVEEEDAPDPAAVAVVPDSAVAVPDNTVVPPADSQLKSPKQEGAVAVVLAGVAVVLAPESAVAVLT